MYIYALIINQLSLFLSIMINNLILLLLLLLLLLLQGRRNVFQSGGGGGGTVAEYFGGGRAIFVRERSDRGAGASIHFSDGGGGKS